MRVIEMTATAGPDGVLRLEVPAVGAGAECQVVVQVKPAAAGAALALAQTPEERGWPRDFIQNVLGSIDDDSFMVHPQPPWPPPIEPLN